MTTTLENKLAQALAVHRAGNLTEAERLYREVVADRPDAADAWHLLGALSVQAGRPAEAVDAIDRAIALNPTNPEYYNHLGAAHGALGNYAQAVEHLRRAVRLAPQSASVHYNLGTALRNDGQLEQAVTSFRHAIAADPDSAEAHYNLANTLRELNRLDEAEAAYRAALAIRPRYIKAMINLGNVLGHLDRYDEAIEILRAAVEADPPYARAHLNLGSVLRDAKRYDEAVAVLETAVSLDPHSGEARNNLGTAYQAQARLDEAGACYERAVALNPNLPDARFSLGTHLLRRGELERGFAEYEARWECKSFSNRTFDQPRWDGSPLEGRTILLYAEQGLGDTLQFVRYVPLVKQRGGTVVVECQEPLLPILAGCEGIDQLVPIGTPPGAFDVRCPLMSLPGVLGLSMEQLWRGPYFSPDEERVARWGQQLAEVPGFRVGVCWQGNPKHLFDAQRSFPLAELAPLAAVRPVQLVSLQKGAGTEQLEDSQFKLHELGTWDEDGAFLDATAILSHLDLVVTADTAIAHVAGAMEVPTWIALSAHVDWRWFLDRDDSPWYPSIRLFRQSQLDVWDDVFQRMAEALAQKIAERA
ncbi:MAG: tetratricopeptide repeat protein [Planctomycetota bacterium]|nr:MAG: tetratricopeptide repeat protein [Planctomycetota bacterium]